MPTIGFAILSHADPTQLARLVRGLNEHFGNPPIACHHDFSQCRLTTSNFPENVHFVRKSRRTGWGRLSVVAAGLDAMALLREVGKPHWTFLLSSADYPVMKAERIRQELASAECDVFADVRPLLSGEYGLAHLMGRNNSKLSHFESTANQRLKRRFYQSPQIWFPIIRLDPRLRPGKLTFRPTFDSPWHPYRNGFACFYGDHWFTANEAAVSAMLDDSAQKQSLMKHLRTRPQADETFYLTILANNPNLKICRDNRRFAEWNGGGAHPMTMTEAQLPEAFSSGAFFARKFAAGTPLLDRIDEHLRS